MTVPLLDIQNLTVRFQTDESVFNAVEDISFHIDRGEIVGLVGESGCGKSVTALSIPRLIPSPPGKIQSGRILFDNQDLTALDPGSMRRIRGKRITMIFQEPSAALSPLQKIGRQMIETLRFHTDLGKRQAREAARIWLEKMKIPDAGERLEAYPYQLSGGMQQRVMIAMALMTEPELLIADEPTTALDVTIQAQIFHLIREMRAERTAILLITHDMGVVWEMCDRVLVMYAANIVEEGPLASVFAAPSHPYTRGLLQSIPRLSERRETLFAIPGQVPSPSNFPSGCHFRDRCPIAFDRCALEKPPMIELTPRHRSACFKAEELNREPGKPIFIQ
ncbi:MAG: ABC transporter ATP-binding protein [Thermodesulfobacteriota bacterium]